MAKRYYKLGAPNRVYFIGRNGREHEGNPEDQHLTITSGYDLHAEPGGIEVKLNWSDLDADGVGRGEGGRTLVLLLTPEAAQCAIESLTRATREVMGHGVEPGAALAQAVQRLTETLGQAAKEAEQALSERTEQQMRSVGAGAAAAQAVHEAGRALGNAKGVVQAAIGAVKASQVLLGTSDVIMPTRSWDALVRALDAYNKGWRSPGYNGDPSASARVQDKS